MPLNNDEIRVAANGRVYIAPKGTAVPTDLAALATAYVDIGALSEDGATIVRKPKIENVMIWQSTVPARYLISENEVTIKMVLMQFNETTLPFYFGGGTVTATGTAPNQTFSYSVSTDPGVDERAMVIEAFDGTLTYRYCFPRVMVNDTDDLALKKTAATGLGLTLGVMAPASGNELASIVTNDQNWAVSA